jgi:hypothetical protein
MIGDGTLESALARNPLALHGVVAPAKLCRAADLLAPDFSLAPEAVSRRASRSVLRGDAEPDSVSGNWTEKSAGDGGEAEALARDYACYTVSALHRISRADVDFPLTARYVSTQNRVV